MNRAIIAIILILVVIVIVAYAFTGFKFLGTKRTTVPIYTTSSTTIQNTTVTTTSINYSNSTPPCSSFALVDQVPNTTYVARCYSNGGTLGLWVASGNTGKEYAKIVGADGKTYINQNSTYNCTTFYQNFTMPSQIYTVTFRTGTGGGSCGNAVLIINTTILPPSTVYNNVYNNAFGNGKYTGWNVTNPGFGTAPLNISYANSKLCYEGRPWSNYNGSYFATTYNCGITVSPGNLTSSPFIADPARPFLNFKLISPQDNNLYVELLRANYKVMNGQQVYYNSTPVAIVHFNTYNLSTSQYSSSTFANVTIPLTLYTGESLQVRLVAKETGSSFIAAGEFILQNRPHQDHSVIVNFTSIG
jgi:hypothetical protein